MYLKKDKEFIKYGNLSSNIYRENIAQINRILTGILISWIVIVSISLILNLIDEKQDMLNLAKLEALTNLTKDLAFRQWAAQHGGVYVPIDERTPPNPALSHIPDRDIISNFGKKYTLMNPAYMLRQLMEDYSELYGIKGHITSLKPINPINTPDTWEQKALKSFESGAKEVFEESLIDDSPYLRLIRPMIVEKACLKCHGYQGYKVGDVRGGVSVSVPLKPYYLLLRKKITNTVLSHFIFLLLGVFGIGFFFKRIRLQENLKKSLLFNKNIIDCSMDMIITADKRGRIDTFNKSAQQTYGYSEDEIMGEDINILSYDLQSEINVMDIVKNKGSFRGDVIRRRKDGSTFHCALSIVAFIDEFGNFNGGVSTARDITEQVQLEDNLKKTLQFTKNIIDSSMDMIIATDKDGMIVEFNLAAQEKFQYHLDEIIGRSLAVIFSNRENFDDIFNETKIRGKFKADTLNICKNGNEFVSALSLSLLVDPKGNILGLVGVLRDITAKKMLEQSQIMLIKELNETNDELKASQEQLVQSEKMASLGQLVAGVAHEINTPVGIALTSSSHLVTLTKKIQTSIENNTMNKSQFEQFLNDTAQGNDLILRNLKRTADLIRSFKMVSADRTSQEIRRFNLKIYINDIIISLRPKLKDIEIEVQCPIDIELVSNPGALAQIITNLIMNSLVHGFDKGRSCQITISCEAVNNVVILKYSDNGKGIPEEYIKKIFDPFFTTKRGSGFTGLGLNIVYNVVNQSLKGTIRCESRIGIGTTFIIELPISLDKEIAMRPYKPMELQGVN